MISLITKYPPQPLLVKEGRVKKIMKIFNKKGFTILEIVVVIFVFSLGMLGLATMVVQNIQVQYVNKDYLIASQLAQEGLELVRNKRDSNWLAETTWSGGLTSGNYIFDYNDYTNNSYSDINSTPFLKINSSGFYNYTSGTPSIFKRLIETTNDSNSINVKCVVQWNDRGKIYNYEADTVLYNWE